MSCYDKVKTPVHNRGVPPNSFLDELIAFVKQAPAERFAANTEQADIYVYIKPVLGPWRNLLHRRAAFAEEMRVHAGFESSWDFNEGVDVTNKTSMAHITGQETGIFQVSFDSTWLDHNRMKPYAEEHGISTPEKFIHKMKADHWLAFDYYSTLVRFNVQWAGPIKRHEIDPELSVASMLEFERLLS